MRNEILIKAAALLLALTLCACSVTGDNKDSGQSGLLSSDASLENKESQSESEAQESSSEAPLQSEISREEQALSRKKKAVEQNRSALDAGVAEIFGKYGAVGGSVSAFCGNELIYSCSYGMADVENEVPITKDTKFRLASVSKVVTALLCVMESERGKYTLDDDIAKLVNPKLVSPNFPEEPMTVRQLLTHTSGIFDGEPYQRATSAGGAFPPLDELLEDMDELDFARPGKSYIYSNFGMGLAAGVVESSAGTRFSDYAEEHLFAPMGISGGFTPDYVKDISQIANVYRGGEMSVRVRDWLGMANAYRRIPIGQMYLLGQGELYISADDLLRVAMILAGDGTEQNKRYLSKESVDEMHAEQFETKQNGATVKMGLGVRIYDELEPGERLYGHEGQAYGMTSGLFYSRGEERCGVSVITNGCSAQRAPNGIKCVNNEILDMIWKCMKE